MSRVGLLRSIPATNWSWCDVQVIEVMLGKMKIYWWCMCLMVFSGCLIALHFHLEGGATRAAMTQHHALRGNIADVAAKDSAQETAVNFIASFSAVLLMSLIGDSLLLFILLMMLHLIFNYLAVRAVCLKTLNEPRYLQLIDTYLKTDVVATLCEINRKEPIVFCQLGSNFFDLKMCGFKIKMGSSIDMLLGLQPKALFARKVNEIYKDRNFMLMPNIRKRTMCVSIKQNASSEDVLCAYLHAVLLSIITCAINNVPLPYYQRSAANSQFAEICRTLQAAKWSRESIENPGAVTGLTYNPSYALLRYVNGIVMKEWDHLRAGMKHTGWDISKHLLEVDEWRLLSNVKPRRIRLGRPLARLVPVENENRKILSFDELLADYRAATQNCEAASTIEPEIESPFQPVYKLPDWVTQHESSVPRSEPVLGITSDKKDTK